jgi:hypothetical protein
MLAEILNVLLTPSCALQSERDLAPNVKASVTDAMNFISYLNTALYTIKEHADSSLHSLQNVNLNVKNIPSFPLLDLTDKVK